MFYISPNRVRKNETPDLMRVFDGFFGDRADQRTVLPIDVREYDDHYLIEVDVPGVAKDRIVLNYEDDLLSIKVDKNDTDPEETIYLHRERSRRMVERKLDLGELDTEKIDAELKDGVLSIKAYKPIIENQRRTIEIK